MLLLLLEPLPWEFVVFRDLEVLIIEDTWVDPGPQNTIPSTFGLLPQLLSLKICRTTITGELLFEAIVSYQATQVAVHSLQFLPLCTGPIPSSLCYLMNIRRLNLGHNHLTGK